MSKKMTPKDAARIQSAISKKSGGSALKDSFASRAQKAAAKNNFNNRLVTNFMILKVKI